MFKDMKVSSRLALGFGCATALGVSIAVLGTLEMREMAGSLEQVTADRMPKMEKAQAVRLDYLEWDRAVRNVAFMSDAARATEKKHIDALRADVASRLAELNKIAVLPKARDALAVVDRTRGAYESSLDRFVKMAEDASSNADLGTYIDAELRPAQGPLMAAVESFVTVQSEAAKDIATRSAATANQNALVLLVLAVAMGALGALTAWALARGLRRALGAEPSALAAAAQRVADGDLSPVPGAAAAPAGSLLESIAHMQESLAGIVGQVRSSSESIAAGSAQIATGNTDLSQRTEEQASNLQQTAASMEQLTGTVKATAATAGNASQLAVNASSAAVRGGELVGGVVRTMDDISTASKKIADIIGVIDGIAFQTNILALNAAVEAARAGEQGRGFAVVASEVRSLAGRSADAAKEIKALIGASVERVEVGTQQVRQAGASMTEIVSQVQSVSTAISEISHAAGEQAIGIAQVGDAVSQLDRVTQQNAALVEQSAAAAESLKHQAARLAEVVGVFRVSEPNVRVPLAQKPMPPALPRQMPVARPLASKPASTPPAAPARAAPYGAVERRGPNRPVNVVRPAFPYKTAAAGGAAVAPARRAPEPAAAALTDEWETF
ncbi:MAG: methyl-accepting chemotaxis protein [Pseudomonadota bacterium]|nr:methyl-accepting chemotaxis protein [Pseudomonadota bacterium]